MMSIIIPCHRVIRADGSLCGYGGGLWRKKWLLDHEQRSLRALSDSSAKSSN
jgi:AraC family transcriptional regulator of adaptative response/methylated-DNA-[protein]-cysteine methyltransferase